MTAAVQNATREWTEAFRARAARTRTPVSATLELTRRCNLRCVHCYRNTKCVNGVVDIGGSARNSHWFGIGAVLK